MTCRTVVKDCKTSEERRQRGFDLTEFCARIWTPKTFYNAGDVIRVLGTEAGGEQAFTGFDYQATEDGTSGETEPSWPVLGADPVADGSLEWEAVEISNTSLVRQIDSVEWIAATGMTVDDETVISTEGRQQIAAYHAGGTDGERYLNLARVTFDDGTIEDFGIRWQIKD